MYIKIIVYVCARIDFIPVVSLLLFVRSLYECKHCKFNETTIIIVDIRVKIRDITKIRDQTYHNVIPFVSEANLSKIRSAIMVVEMSKCVSPCLHDD